MRRNKKGFTIVELVIVIAVIGVLAAVLIPTFVNLTNKANQAADDSLVKNLNTALATQEGVPGDVKNSTLHEAVEELEEYGYKLPNLVTKSHENTLLWNSKTNRFLLEKDLDADKSQNSSKNMKNVDYFHIQDNLDGDKGYSIYAGNGFSTSNPVNLTKGQGFDAGFKTFETISYTRAYDSATDGTDAHNVVIRTNGAITSLTVDAQYDTVKHYGSLGALNIIKANTASYHENGKVAYAEISYGRIVLESGSKIEEVHVNKLTESSFDTVIIANNGGAAELPDRITRDAVTVSGETLVVKVESNGSSENVYVYADGVTGNRGSTEKTATQNTEVESALGQLVLDNGSNPGEKAQTAEEKAEAKREVVNEAIENTEFKGVAISIPGEDTQLMTLEDFRDAVNAGNTYAGYTVKLLDNINLENVEWTPLKLFAGTFDGNYKILSGLKLNATTSITSGSVDIGFFEKTENATIKNLTISDFEVYGTGRIASGALIGNASNGLTLSNIILTSSNKLTGKWSGGFIGKTTVTKDNSELRDCKYIIDNCHSSVEIEGERTGGFIGQMDGSDNSIYQSSNGFATFTSCSFNGKLNANTGTAMAGGFIAQQTNGNRTWFVYTFQSCSVDNRNIESNNCLGDFTAVSQNGYSLFKCRVNDSAVTLPTQVRFAFCNAADTHSYSIDGTIYAIKAANGGYYNVESDTIGVDAQVAGSSNHSISLSDTTDWHRVTNAYIDFYGNYIVSADASAIYRSVPTNLEEGTKLQRRTYVAGYDYSVRQYTYGFDMWRIVNNDVEAEEPWQDVDTDGSTGFVLGAGIYYYSDPTPFVDLELYEVSSRETSDHWMIYTVTAK